MANKNIKNSAREARAKKMELVKEKNYQETMKKLKLKKEEDAERKKTNKTNKEKKAAAKNKKPVVTLKAKKPEPPPVMLPIKEKKEKSLKPKAIPQPPKKRGRPRKPQIVESVSEEESPDEEINEQIEIIEREDTPEPQAEDLEEESELIEIIEVNYDENEEELENGEDDDDDDSNEIIKVIEVIEDPDDDYIIDEIEYLDNQHDEKSENDDDRTILVTIENDDSQLTNFSQDSICIEVQVQDSSQDGEVLEEEEVPMVVQEEVIHEEKVITNQYAAAFESLSTEAKFNIFASLINTKTPEKPNVVQNMEVDDQIVAKQNIEDVKVNLLTKLPNNLVIDNKFFESFTHKRVNGEATVSDEKLTEVTEKLKCNNIFSEMLCLKNYNSESKSSDIENVEKPEISHLSTIEKPLISELDVAKDESLQEVESFNNECIQEKSSSIPEPKPSENESLQKVENFQNKEELVKPLSSPQKSDKQIINEHKSSEKLEKMESSKRSRSHKKSKEKIKKDKSSKHKHSEERLKNHKHLDKSVSPKKERVSKSKSCKSLENNEKNKAVHTKSPKKLQETPNDLQMMDTLEKIENVEILNSESLEKLTETINQENNSKIESLQNVETFEKSIEIAEIDISKLQISAEIFEIVSECSKIIPSEENSVTESLHIKNEIVIPEIPPKTTNIRCDDLKNEVFQDLNNFENSCCKSEIPTDSESINQSSQNDSFQFDENFLKKEENETGDSIKCDDEEKEVRRRSSRIKIISQSKRRSHGHGLVKDKDRFIKAIEPTTPLISTPLTAEEQEKILEHERDMQQRLSKFLTIKENEYYCDRNISKEAKKMTCDCFLTEEEIEAGEFGCGEDCLNRLLMIECGNRCVVGDRCTNRRFQKNLYSKCDVFRTEKKGFGILASKPIRGGEFIMEYVGEVLTRDLFEKRVNDYSKNQNTHFYFMSLRSEAYIDATIKGNISRFINHSCDPNAETQKWTVNGELKIGFFSRRDIAVDEEITFDYEFQNYGKEAQKCYCESANCRGWIGEEPDSDTDDSDESDEEDDEDTESIIDEVKQFELKNLNQNENSEKSTEISSVETSILTEEKQKIPRVPKIKVKKPKVPKVKKPKKIRTEIMDDNDLDDEIMSLRRTGVKRKEHILKLSRLMVRAKNIEARCNILCLIMESELPCRRLFLDYQGLRLLYGWLSDSIVKETNSNLILIIQILETLKTLPISNKTMTKDSKVFPIIEKWASSKNTTICSPTDDSPSPEMNSSPIASNTNKETLNENSSPKTVVAQDEVNEINLLKTKVTNLSVELYSMWENLKEIFKIPKNMKRERIEQQKEHERQADISYKSLGIVDDEIDSFRYRSRYRNQCMKGKPIESWVQSTNAQASIANNLRRDYYAQQIIREQQEHEEIMRIHFLKCNFFGLDPSLPLRDLPFEVNCSTNEWYTFDNRKIPMPPPAYSQMQLAEKKISSKIEEFNLPPMNLPQDWTFGITNGLIFYYHVKIRIPQWEPPIFFAPLSVDEKNIKEENIKVEGEFEESEIKVDLENVKIETEDVSSEEMSNDEEKATDADSETDESDGEETNLINILENLKMNTPDILPIECILSKDIMDEDEPQVLKSLSLERIRKKMGDDLDETEQGEYLNDMVVSNRNSLLYQERVISPRSAGDRKYGREQNKKYKATKERIRKDKKKRLISPPPPDLHPKKIRKLTEGLPSADNENSQSSCDENLDNLSTSIELAIKAEDVETEQCEKDQEKPFKKHSAVYEEWKKQQIKLKAKKRGGETVTQPTSRRKIEEPVVPQKEEARKIKDKFRTDIAGIIVQHLSFYKRETCEKGRITNNEDFKHLARKLTHFVMLKELKHCDNAVTYLEVTESVKIKAREYIKKYMGKHGEVYVRGENEPDYKE